MSKYTVEWCKGDYPARQQQANQAGCVGYVEHHFNALAVDKPGVQDNPALVIVGANASTTSKNWAAWYSRAIASAFGVRDLGVSVGPARGDGNLRYTRMPAVLLEPLYCSEPLHAAVIRSVEGQRRLAGVLVDSIRRFFPDGGKLGFSVGHKYKASSPHDRGAAVVGGGMEAEYAERVLQVAEELLMAELATPARRLRIEELTGASLAVKEVELDADDVVTWNPVSEVLQIRKEHWR